MRHQVCNVNQALSMKTSTKQNDGQRLTMMATTDDDGNDDGGGDDDGRRWRTTPTTTTDINDDDDDDDDMCDTSVLWDTVGLLLLTLGVVVTNRQRHTPVVNASLISCLRRLLAYPLSNMVSPQWLRNDMPALFGKAATIAYFSSRLVVDYFVDRLVD